jgi:signal transduction histidine kinase
MKTITALRRARAPSAKAPRWWGLPGYVAIVLLGFLVATAAFVSSTLYANARLEAVAQRSHDVTGNALPSVIELGAMRLELAQVHHILDEASEGTMDELPAFRGHMSAYLEARRHYEALPRFEGEPELWARAVLRLDEVERLARDIGRFVDGRALHEADVLVTNELVPAMHSADDALADVIALNRDEGNRAAVEADAALARSRRLSIFLDTVSIAVTAALAMAAYLNLRGHDLLVRRRTEELEAFASRVAHDVRGPLTPAVFALQSIARKPGPDGESRRAAAERGLRSLGRVEDLVRDLLTFARGGAAPEPGAHASLREVVAGVLQDVQSDAAAARVYVAADDLPDCEIACARGMLASVAINLVSNAIKYMPTDWDERKVVVRATHKGNRVRVEVADTGAGLPEEAQRRVFEPYVRLDANKPGLGLGLATVRRLVEAHGGTVGVQSREGEGAVFWFEMPVHTRAA